MVFLVGRLLCMPYSGCTAACPFDTQVSPVVMNCSNPVSILPEYVVGARYDPVYAVFIF